MRLVVLGADLMGKEIARDLATNDFVQHILLADTHLEKGQQVVAEIGSEKMETIAFDAENDENLREVMKQGDLVVNSLFSVCNDRVVQAAVDVGVHVLDLGGQVMGVTEAVLDLADQAATKNMTIIRDVGIAPGIVNILTGYGVSRLDRVDSVKIYVGSIPTGPQPPLHYTHVFPLDNVFDQYTEPSKAIYKGVLTEIEPLTGMEPIYFDEFGMLEAFYTSGGMSTLYKTFPDVKTLEYKTICYKGHADLFRLLAQLGFLDRDNVVNVDGEEVAVRSVVREALKKKLELEGKADAVLVRTTIVGEKNEEQVTYEYEMVVKKDMGQDISAMARATVSSISSIINMIQDGIIDKHGVYSPESIIPGDIFMAEMKKRGIVIKETTYHSTTIVKW